jgi:hypothetical protein
LGNAFREWSCISHMQHGYLSQEIEHEGLH